MVRFSVIIPTYGRSKLLAEATASVLAQSVKDLEVIIVDDASPQPVEAPCDPRVRLVRAKRNGGAARARNLGVEAASGELIAFLDDDDTWTRCRLEYAAKALERSPVAICWQSAGRGRVLEGNVYDTILDEMTPHLGATALHRSAWIPLDETYRTCEDIVWWLAVSREFRVATHPAQGLIVRRHDGPRAGYGIEQRVRDSLRLMSNFSDYFKSHPRAASFRLKRLGIMELSLGRRREAREFLLRALVRRPNLADLWHLGRAYWPQGLA